MIREYVDRYKNDEQFGSNGRFRSFDHCFNYFQSFRYRNAVQDLANEAHLETSCVQLGFYLASWGMYRASSTLLQRNSRGLVGVVREIAGYDQAIWDIDADQYTDENIEMLMGFRDRIRSQLKDVNVKASDTLVTKIILGTLGAVPAYDRYVKSAFQRHNIPQSFGRRSLEQLRHFYDQRKDDISSLRDDTFTVSFSGCELTRRKYTHAKIIDMYCFEKGREESPNGRALESEQKLAAS